jgi:carbon storage regulator CsrA
MSKEAPIRVPGNPPPPDSCGLTLTRKVGESIVCDLGDGRELVITLHELRRGQARIRVLAPPDVLVLREELTGREAT